MDVSNVPVVMKPKTWLSPPKQSRSIDDPAELARLAANIGEYGMLQPILAEPSGQIIAGHRRWQAVMSAEQITEVPVKVIHDPLTSSRLRVLRISENLHRSDLSTYDKYLECRGFREEEPDMTAKEIAAALHVDASTITRYLCLDNCVEAVRQAVKENRIGLKAVYEISKEAPSRQEELLAEALAGGAERVARARKKAAGTVPAERVKRCRFARPSGALVTLTGEEMSLEEAAKELSDLAADMRQADKKKITIKTFMANCRDQAVSGQ